MFGRNSDPCRISWILLLQVAAALLVLSHSQSILHEDVDECQESALHRCSPPSLCSNTVGSYRCTCPQGYADVDPSNPGTNCADLNECATGEHDCSPWAICTNTLASYACACLEGFVDNNPERPGRVCQTTQTLERLRDTFGTSSSLQVSSTSAIPPLKKRLREPKVLSPPRVTLVSLVKQTRDQFNAQAAIPSSSITLSDTQSTPQTLPTSHIAPLTSTTPDPLETPTSALKTVAFFSASSTETPAVTPNTLTPAISASQTASAVLKTNSITINSATVVSSSSIPAVTVRTTDSSAVTSFATNAKRSHITTTTDLTTTTAALRSSNSDQTATGAIPANTLTALRTATSASVLGGISVQCRLAAITVTIAQTFLVKDNIQESALYLGSRECGVNGRNATHVQLTVAWNQCSTRLVHNETHYAASVTLFSTMEPRVSPDGTVETPRIRSELPISCGYVKNMLISADFTSMGKIKEVISSSGSFQMILRLLNNTTPLPHNSTLSCREAVVMDVRLNTSSEQIKVVVSKCWATPTHNPEDTHSHTFWESSCPTNMYARAFINGNSSTSRLSVQIFSIVNITEIYLHCQVQICVQIGEENCVPDCLPRTRIASRNILGSALRSSGPLLKPDEEATDEKTYNLQIAGISCLGISVTLFFLLTFFCLLYCQRNRIGNLNLTVTPKQDNQTFLVFNA